MHRAELIRRLDAATQLNAKRPTDSEYLVACPTRGDFQAFGTSPQDAVALVDAHEDRKLYEGVTVYGPA